MQPVSLFNNKSTRFEGQRRCDGESRGKGVNESESKSNVPEVATVICPSILPRIIVPLCSSSPGITDPSNLSSSTSSQSDSA
jgi:hypothetical protein